MTATMKQTLGKLIEEVEHALAQPRFLFLAPRIVVHAPTVDTGKCACCGSVTASIVDTIKLPEMLVDTSTGLRVYADQVSPRCWEAVKAEAAHHTIYLRCSVQQAPLLLSEDDRDIMASGGNRSGKTTLGLYWIAKQWLQRGGPQRRFWLVASTLPKAFRLLEKLFKGTGESPPVLPESLVRSMPETPRASNLLTTLVDGTFFDLRYFEGDPGAEKVKSDAIVAALVDEAAHMPGPDTLTALKGRCLDAGGRLFLASTPRPGSFLKKDVVEAAQGFARLPEDDPDRIGGKHPGARWRLASFSIPENPWLDPAEVARSLAAVDPEDPSTLRDFFGQWISNSGYLWREFSVERHVYLDEGRDLAAMQRILAERGGATMDVTERVARRIFVARPSPHWRGMRATNLRRILGADVNCHPMTTVDLQVSADPERPDDRDHWHVWVHDAIQSKNSNTLRHGERLVDLAWVRIWAPSAKASPFLGCGIVVDPTAISRDPTAHKHGRDPIGLAETWGALGFDTRAPAYRIQAGGSYAPVRLGRHESHELVHKLLRQGRLHLAQRALALIESFQEQEDSGNGIEPLTRSHEKSDILASPMDALRYAVWAIFHGGHETIRGN